MASNLRQYRSADTETPTIEFRPSKRVPPIRARAEHRPVPQHFPDGHADGSHHCRRCRTGTGPPPLSSTASRWVPSPAKRTARIIDCAAVQEWGPPFSSTPSRWVCARVGVRRSPRLRLRHETSVPVLECLGLVRGVDPELEPLGDEARPASRPPPPYASAAWFEDVVIRRGGEPPPNRLLLAVAGALEIHDQIPSPARSAGVFDDKLGGGWRVRAG